MIIFSLDFLYDYFKKINSSWDGGLRPTNVLGAVKMGTKKKSAKQIHLF